MQVVKCYGELSKASFLPKKTKEKIETSIRDDDEGGDDITIANNMIDDE